MSIEEKIYKLLEETPSVEGHPHGELHIFDWSHDYYQNSGKMDEVGVVLAERLVEFVKQAQKEVAEKALKQLETVKEDMDVVVCDCGEPYKGTDPYDCVLSGIETLKPYLEDV